MIIANMQSFYHYYIIVHVVHTTLTHWYKFVFIYYIILLIYQFNIAILSDPIITQTQDPLQ